MIKLFIEIIAFAIILSLLFVKFQKSLGIIFPSEEELNEGIKKCNE